MLSPGIIGYSGAVANGLLTGFRAGWEFSESSGNTSVNVGGNTAYDITNTGTTIVTGLIGNARNFSNSNSVYATCPSAVWSDQGTTFTARSYHCRIRMSTVQNSVIMRHDGESGGCGFLVSINSAGKVETFQNVTGNYSFPGGYMVATGTTVLSANTWYDITVTYDGTYTKIYLDGVLEVTFNVYAASGYSSTYNIYGSYYTGYFGHNQSSGNARFLGDLDCFYIWDTCLTSTQAAAAYRISYSDFN